MLFRAVRDGTKVASVEVVLVELLLLAPMRRGKEQTAMVSRPGERPGIGRRRLEPLELARPGPVEHEPAGMLREHGPELDRLLRPEMSQDLELLLGFGIVLVGRKRRELADLREGLAALLLALVVPVHQGDRRVREPLDVESRRGAAREERAPRDPEREHERAETRSDAGRAAHERASSRRPRKGGSAIPVGSKRPTSCTRSPSTETTICAASGKGKSGWAAKARSSWDR
jgi:hypothetical protein